MMKKVSISAAVMVLAAFPYLAADTALATSVPRIEEVNLHSGSIRLAGRLYLPNGRGSFPAIVFTHGSGPSGCDSPRYQEEASFFAAAGIASLIYDKRGYGHSTGDWKTATFDDLASDAIAAVEFLKTRPEIKSIGLRGASQSGWILPIAATRCKDIAFLIMISPPGVTPYEQVIYDVRTDLEDAGFSPPEVELALDITRSGLEYARTGQGWSEHKKKLSTAAGQKWLKIASGPADPDDWLWKWIHPLLDFDAVPVVQELRIPVLVLLGEQDRETPSQVAGYRLSQALRNNQRFLVRYFANADHDLRDTKADKVNGHAPFAPGYLESIKDWVLATKPKN